MMMLLTEYRIVQVRVNTTSLTISASQWWQYRIGLSSLLWSLVTDGLLEWLSKQGIFTQNYADDRTLLVCGKFIFFLFTVSEIIQRRRPILCGIEKQCPDRVLCQSESDGNDPVHQTI